MHHSLLIVLSLLMAASLATGEEPDSGPKSAEAIARETRPSLVTITHESRRGQGGEGSGFFVSPGLIATNLHVIQEARPIHVTTSDGRELTVTAVHASDRKLDLALVEVAEEDVPALPLGDSSALPDGLSVVAMGNPQGFEFSVVEGIISATRDFDGVSMIQLAIPIEPGNSGGPLLDRHGKVIGIPSMKSQLTDNIGFAMPVNAVKLLLEKPNPIPIDRWVTVGRLSPHKWQPVQEGARWRQRAGTITVRGQGKGFGGRALCLFQRRPNEGPYEVAVKVKLDAESGAAGLVFASDGGDRHYGFYPSGGNIRLTHFAGPDVFSWNILFDQEVASYQKGEWNLLRMVVDETTLTGYVNGVECVRLEHDVRRGGQVGLCKFRETEASFQAFRLQEAGETLPADDALREELAAAVNAWVTQGNEHSRNLLEKHPVPAQALLVQRAQALEKQASDLRAWSLALHQQHVCQRMATLLSEKGDAEIDLFHAGLLIAKLNLPELDVDAYREELESMAEDVREDLPEEATASQRLEKVSDYLFRELGFHGSRLDYYTPENSYLSAVLDDREGIPITLSVLYMELAHRVGVTGVVGIPLPGHFMVQCQSADEEDDHFLIDAFDSGKRISQEEAADLAWATARVMLEDAHLEPASKREILVRMLRNLIGIDLGSAEPTRALPRLDLLLTIAPEEASERLSRALLRYQANAWEKALEDLTWILERQPEGIHLGRVEELDRRIRASLE